MGQRLAAVMNEAIEALVGEETSRAEVVAELGQAAGIDAGTVNQILDGSIDCPPLQRLRGFARVLDVSLSQLQDAAEADGCEYGNEANSAPSFERRCVTHEVRMEEIAGQRHIIGYGAVFEEPSQDLGGFVEIVERGAFTRALEAQADVRGLVNHDPVLILGRTSAGTMTLTADPIGLRYDIIKPDTSYADDLAVSMQRGDITQSSFGFRARRDRWENRDGQHFRFLMDVDIFDVGPVTFPAYPQTSAEARAMAEMMGATSQGTGKPNTDEGRAVGRLALQRRKLDLIA